MRIHKIALVALAVFGAAASLPAQAAQVSCNGATCTTTPGIGVQFSITIPAILRFVLGPSGVGGATPAVSWTNVTAANIGDSNALTPTVSNSNTATAGAFTYQLISNNGSGTVTVTADTTGFAAGPTCSVGGCNGTSIPWSEITRSQTGSLTNPNFGNSTSPTVTAGAVLNLSGEWSFQYANTTVPVAGSYSATVTYTASQAP